MKKTIMSDRGLAPGTKAIIEVVSMNYRYVSAWSEVNTRIAQRQNALTIFVTLSSFIVTVLLSSKKEDSLLDPHLFTLLIPVFSLVFGFLNYKHDTTIALLRNFLAKCERQSKPYDQKLKLLTYNDSDHYSGLANSIRKFHDYSCAVLIAIFNILGVVAVWHAFPNAFRWDGWPFIVYCFFAVSSIILVMYPTLRPHKFGDEQDND